MMKKASSWALSETGMWIIAIILIIALLIVIAWIFGGIGGVWESIRNAIRMGG